MAVRIKICGITTPGDAAGAARLGADAIGLNFYSRSPRHVAEARAIEILAALPVFVEPVALFVDEDLEQVRIEAHRLGIRTVQIHGEHGKAPPAGPVQFIPAFAIANEGSLSRIMAYLDLLRSHGRRPPAILVDAHVPGLHGGTGQVAPWNLLADFSPGVPLILAGGLTPDNVAEAIRIVRPYAVDVASGVESAPGHKDLDKVARFIDKVRRSQ